MIIYSAVPPLFEIENSYPESFSEVQNGVPVFYEKDSVGNSVLKFSTDPKMYLERNKPLQ